MGLRWAVRISGVVVGAALCVTCCAPSWAGDRAAPPPEPQPTLRIPVEPLGYMPPSNFYLTYRLSSASLGFFDDSHLLFTFRTGGLLRRIPGDSPDDDDQQIHAVVLDARTGNLLRHADWRMHDRSQYLWPLAGGQFLLRFRNNLYLTDSSLELKLYLRIDTDLRAIQVSPDRQWIVLESDDPDAAAQKPASSEDLGLGKPVRILVIPAGSNKARAASTAKNPVGLPLLGDSLVETLEGKAMASWLIRATPLGSSQGRTLAEIRSGCEPTVQPVSATVTLAMGCFSGSDDRPVVAVSSQGKQLWTQTWQNKYVWPWFSTAEDGSRFAYESIETSRPISTFDALYPEDVRGQLVGVYDTATGKLVLVRDASPVLSAGQNAALSPDGRRFAILRQGAIEIYDLPPVDQDTPRKQSREIARQKK